RKCGNAPGARSHQAGVAGDGNPVDVDSRADGRRLVEGGRVECHGPRARLEQGHAVVRIDRHVVVGVRDGAYPDFLGDAGQDLIALIEVVGDVATCGRADLDPRVDRLELGQQVVEPAHRTGNVRVRLASHTLHGLRGAVQR